MELNFIQIQGEESCSRSSLYTDSRRNNPGQGTSLYTDRRKHNPIQPVPDNMRSPKQIL